ncbi:MAG: transporter substrate-binding domain-containing protein [Deltaproteobacteria bacterium]|nr:transporter substrate-binding domain-containing protein [Deltaproteobacteria bacterium]
MFYFIKSIFYRILITSLLVTMMNIELGATPKIRVVYTEWFPYTFEEQGKASGFEIDIFKAIMKRMGIPVEFGRYPWKRCLDHLKKGKADALISMLYTSNREQYTYFAKEHISVSRTIFATTKNRQISFNGALEDLRSYVIGYIMGFSYGQMFDTADYLNKDSATNVQGLIKKLIKGRNDLIAENEVVLRSSAFKLGVLGQIKFIEPPIHIQNLFVGFSKVNGLEELSIQFSRELSSFKKLKQYTKILAQYNIPHTNMGTPH